MEPTGNRATLKHCHLHFSLHELLFLLFAWLFTTNTPGLVNDPAIGYNRASTFMNLSCFTNSRKADSISVSQLAPGDALQGDLQTATSLCVVSCLL